MSLLDDYLDTDEAPPWPALPSAPFVLANVLNGFLSLLVCLFPLVVIGIAALMIATQGEWWVGVIVTAVAILSVCASAPVIIEIGTRLQGVRSLSEPIMLDVARSYVSASRQLRFLLTVWWLLHAAQSVFVPMMLAFEPRLFGPQPLQAIDVVGIALLNSLYASVAFGFILLAVASLCDNDEILGTLHRWRWIWGFSFGGACLVAPLLP